MPHRARALSLPLLVCPHEMGPLLQASQWGQRQRRAAAHLTTPSGEGVPKPLATVPIGLL